jgi:flagellar protein FliT
MQQYESISRLSAAMLAAAQDGHWEDLIEAQQYCAEIVDALRALPESALDTAQQRRKFEIIRKILAEDAKVRDLTQPRMAELDHLLRGYQAQRNIGQAYR